MMNTVAMALENAATKRGVSLASLSRLLRRNPAYLQQFVKRGTPRKLDEADRRILADYLGIDEGLLGAPEDSLGISGFRSVPRLAVEASAGSGAMVDNEIKIAEFSFDRAWLRRLSRSRPDQLAVIRVTGDSMSPTLADGDDILVDRGENAVRPRDGIFVLRRDDTLLVKRLAVNPSNATVTIASDNPAYPVWSDCPLASIKIVGRVIWAARRFV